MADDYDLVQIAVELRQSMEKGHRDFRRMRFFALRDLFGFRVWSPQRKKIVARLLAHEGIISSPPIVELSLNDWIVLSLLPTSSGTDGGAPPTAFD